MSHVGRRSPRRTQTITETGVPEIPTKKTTKSAKTSKATPKADPKKARKGGKAKTPAVETTPAKKLSQIAAAERVLAEADEPMNCKAMVEAMANQGLWSSPGGKTPHATLYAAILREINTKGEDARFRKTDRGLFTLATK